MTDSDESQPSPGHALPKLPAARWGEPILRADALWTRFEITLAMFAFSLEVLSMSVWVCLKGISSPHDYAGGIVFRGFLGATILGIAARLLTRKSPERTRQFATLGGVFLGLVTAGAWGNVGVQYSSNVLNWYQQASFLTLLGGLRGVGTRLTMLLALLGGSLATGKGRHIVIDIITRFVTYKTRVAMAIVCWVTAAVVCTTAAWGFFDHVSIENFGADADSTPGQKIARVAAGMEEDFFIARKQLALDFKSVPHVILRGETYSEWLKGAEWNAWLEGSGFAERYGKGPTDALRLPETDARAPIVVLPGRGEPRGELISVGYLVFPIGLLVIALRFLVRCLLVLSGQVSVESDESEDWGENRVAPVEGES